MLNVYYCMEVYVISSYLYHVLTDIMYLSHFLLIVELFSRNYEFHHHYTRQSQSLHTAVGRKEAISKTYTFHGIEFGTTYQQKFQ